MAVESPESSKEASILKKPIILGIKLRDWLLGIRERIFTFGKDHPAIEKMPEWVPEKAISIKFEEEEGGGNRLGIENTGDLIMVVAQFDWEGQKSVGIRHYIVLGSRAEVDMEAIDPLYSYKLKRGITYEVTPQVSTLPQAKKANQTFTKAVQIFLINIEQTQEAIGEVYNNRFRRIRKSDYIVFNLHLNEKGKWVLNDIEENRYTKKDTLKEVDIEPQQNTEKALVLEKNGPPIYVSDFVISVNGISSIEGVTKVTIPDVQVGHAISIRNIPSGGLQFFGEEGDQYCYDSSEEWQRFSPLTPGAEWNNAVIADLYQAFRVKIPLQNGEYAEIRGEQVNLPGGPKAVKLQYVE